MSAMSQNGILETELYRPEGSIPVGIPYTYRKQYSRPAIVYLHGLGCSQQDFAGAFDHHALDKYSLFSFDYPGCGQAEYPEDAQLQIEDLITITHDVVSYFGMRRVLLVGHSLGGVVAQRYLQGELLLEAVRFANVEGNLVPGDCYFSRQASDMGLDDFLDHGFSDLKDKLTGSDSKGDREYARNLETANPRAFFYLSRSLVEHSDNGTLLDGFIGMRQPKVFIYGDRGREQEADSLPALAELRRNGIPTMGIPASDHFPMHDNPEVFFQALADFEDQNPL